MLSNKVKVPSSGRVQLPPGYGLRVAPVPNYQLPWPIQVEVDGNVNASCWVNDSGVYPLPRDATRKGPATLALLGLSADILVWYAVAETPEELLQMQPGNQLMTDSMGQLVVTV